MRMSSCLALLALLSVPACASDTAGTENRIDNVGSDAGGSPAPGNMMGTADAGIADAGSTPSGRDAATPSGRDAATPSGRDAATPINKVDDGNTPGNDANGLVSCGSSAPACDLKSQACCVTGLGEANTKCQNGTACAAGNPTPCDGPEECGAGQACCVTPGLGITACKKGACGSIDITLCHTDSDCAAGKSCSRSSVTSWWGRCN